MNTQEMIRRSGLMPPMGTQDALALRDRAAQPLPEPKPIRPAPQGQATPAPAAATPATPEPTGPVDHVTVADLAEEFRSTAVRVMQAMPEKFRGPVGPKGDPGQNISAEACRKIIAEEIERAISSQPDRFRGQPGHSVTLDDTRKLVAEAVHQTIAANPERFRGLKGDPSTVPGPIGPAGKTIIVERNIIERGPKGDPGRDSTVPGPAGLNEAQITELVCRILTDPNVASEQQLKLLGLTIEMQNIRDDQSLHRLGMVREQLLKRLESKLL